MTVNHTYIILDNNDNIKNTILMVLAIICKINTKMICVNINYNNNSDVDSYYSGLKYVARLRAEEGNNSPVLIYGFESLEYLKKNPEASILNCTAIDYIQMPFRIDQLSNIILKLTVSVALCDSLDETSLKVFAETNRVEALRLLSVLRHDILNVKRNLESIYLLSWSGDKDFKLHNRRSVEKTIYLSKDSISAIRNEIMDNLQKFKNILSANTLTKIIDNLAHADRKFDLLRSNLTKSTNADVESIIINAEEILDLLSDIPLNPEMQSHE